MMMKAYASGGVDSAMSNTAAGQRLIRRNIESSGIGRQAGRGGVQGMVARAQRQGMQNPSRIERVPRG